MQPHPTPKSAEDTPRKIALIFTNLTFAECTTLGAALRSAHDKSIASGAVVPGVVTRHLLRIEQALTSAIDARHQKKAPQIGKKRSVRAALKALRSLWVAVIAQLSVWAKTEGAEGDRPAATLLRAVFGARRSGAFLSSLAPTALARSEEKFSLLAQHGAAALFAAKGATELTVKLAESQRGLAREFGVNGTLHPEVIQADVRRDQRDIRGAIDEYVKRVQYSIACPDCAGSVATADALVEPIQVIARLKAKEPKRTRKPRAKKAAAATKTGAATPTGRIASIVPSAAPVNDDANEIAAATG